MKFIRAAWQQSTIHTHDTLVVTIVAHDSAVIIKGI